MTELCVICAAPRSGTTFLSDAVERAYGAVSPGEIFHEAHANLDTDFRHTDDPQRRANFFAFRAEASRRDPEFIYPSLSARRRLFDLYVQDLPAACRSDRVLIDIKYNSWHHLDGYWRFPTEPPGLLDLIREHNIPVIHLIRRNLFALYCSQQMAQKSNLWSMEKSEGKIRAYGIHRDEEIQVREPSADAGPLTVPVSARVGMMQIDLDHCEQWMVDMASTQKQFARWLGESLTYTLAYEDLMDHRGYAECVYEAFTNVYGSPIGEMTTVFAKILPALSRVVENTEAVSKRFAGTEFEGFVRASLEPDALSTGY